MQNQLPVHDAYIGYETWKGWKKLFHYSNDDDEYYRHEMRSIHLDDACVLELGFGAGGFMAWAKNQGCQVAGTECNDRLAAEARARGFSVVPHILAAHLEKHAGYYDLVVGFDVAEHWTLAELQHNISIIEKLLCDGGVLILRFPNSQSPFGLAAQFGDPTHKTCLSRGTFEYLCRSSKLSVIRYGSAARILGRSPPKIIIRAIRYLLRAIIGAILGFAYSNSHPFDPTVVIVLRKATQT